MRRLILIALSAAWLGFAYLGYPLILLLLARLSPRPVGRGDTPPKTSVIIAVHNGGQALRHKLESTLALDYPDRFEVIVDGIVAVVIDVVAGGIVRRGPV